MSVFRFLLTLLALMLTLSVFGQKRFQPGYYIDNQGNRSEGLIKNESWAENPTEFDFKADESAKAIPFGIDQIKEFGIDGVVQFIKANVEIDRSPSNYNFLTGTPDPQFSNESLFLMVLMNGKASLYSYKEGDLQRYFYATESQAISQLIYKTYSKAGKLAYNNTFKSQLLQDVSCGESDVAAVRKLEYKKKSLLKYFEQYNICEGIQMDTPSSSTDIKSSFNFKPILGYQFSKIHFVSEEFDVDYDFDNHSGILIGFEAELTLPVKKAKWSVIVQPVFFSYQSSERSIQTATSGADYSGLTFGAYLRRYFPLSNELDFYLDGGFSPTLPLTDTFAWGSRVDVITDSAVIGLTAGAGVRINRKLLIDIKRHFGRNLLNNRFAFKSNLSTTQIGLAYEVFSKK